MITKLILRSALLACLALASMVLPASTGGILAEVATESFSIAALPTAEGQPSDAVVWNTWGASQYALADDGEAIWIGATGGVVRWDKALRSYRRFAQVDGLPQSVVLTVAVDSAGNRWFGGDGGLSRLDPGERWSHFTTANSGLYANYVDAIAVGGSDALYLSHGLPDGAVSRRSADGTWSWFPNREAAVQADYAVIRQTRSHTRLWSVAGTEVWCGYRVFDGATWHERIPPDAVGEPLDMVVDSRRHVWALGQTAIVYEWDGTSWAKHYVQLNFTGRVTALTVAADDTVWIGLQTRGSIPYSQEEARVKQLTGTISWSLGVSGPVAALLPTTEGLWAVGPGWLMQPPNNPPVIIRDAPLYKSLPDILLEPAGKLWLYSGYFEPYSVGAVQTLDDNGTAALHDDQWQVGSSGCVRVIAWERATAGDVWYVSECSSRFPSPSRIVRYLGQTRVDYPQAPSLTYEDIYVEDARHAWFAARGQVVGLDDGGTPTDTSDDIWQSMALPAAGAHPVVAVDARSRLWYGDATGLYRYDGASWLPIYTSRGICDVTQGADGKLYAQLASYGSSTCQPYAGYALIVGSDGTSSYERLIETLVTDETESVCSASRRNTLWAVAPDGAIWTVAETAGVGELHRRDAAGLRTYPLPVTAKAVQRLEVDAGNRVWLAANSQIWRMSRPLDFAIEAIPEAWLLAAGQARHGQIRIVGIEGYDGSVRLSAVEPPAGITVRFGSDTLMAGQSGALTLEAAPTSPVGIYRLVISASDEMLTHTVALTVTVASELRDVFLPMAGK